MKKIAAVNDFVIKFANVNGSGSASANNMFAKAIFRMGVAVSAKNIFPSNIQGLPTWYEVRANDKGYTGRRGGIDIMVSINPQSMAEDMQELQPGGYFVYDSSKPLTTAMCRDDVTVIGLPLTDMCLSQYDDPRQRQLFRNVIYVGALAALLDIEFAVLTELVAEQFKGKEKLIAPNIQALEMGHHYAKNNFDCPLAIRVERSDSVGDAIFMDGNAACALGAIYAGATVAAWYPITPSTSVVDNFNKYANRLRIDPGSGEKYFAIVQAEDELSAIGMTIGANWNGARAFTATSGPGISLMSEFLGLAYFAEIPTVLINVQRAGPSTGMPTRSQQSDVLSCAYASHGDTKQVLLFPSCPHECFTMTADAFDLTERLQTPVILMSDLDLGMNDTMAKPLSWDDERKYDRGKVLDSEALEQAKAFGRYTDVDGDGICYRTYPGAHPTKGSFFTRGTSRDEKAIYTEKGEVYAQNMTRLLRKWETAKCYVPVPEYYPKGDSQGDIGLVFFGTSAAPCIEAIDMLKAHGVAADGMRLRAFPFQASVKAFIERYRQVFVIEQNRDGQMRTLLQTELSIVPDRLLSVLNFDGMPITARNILAQVKKQLPGSNVTSIAFDKAEH